MPNIEYKGYSLPIPEGWTDQQIDEFMNSQNGMSFVDNAIANNETPAGWTTIGDWNIPRTLSGADVKPLENPSLPSSNIAGGFENAMTNIEPMVNPEQTTTPSMTTSEVVKGVKDLLGPLDLRNMVNNAWEGVDTLINAGKEAINPEKSTELVRVMEENPTWTRSRAEDFLAGKHETVEFDPSTTIQDVMKYPDFMNETPAMKREIVGSFFDQRHAADYTTDDARMAAKEAFLRDKGLAPLVYTGEGSAMAKSPEEQMIDYLTAEETNLLADAGIVWNDAKKMMNWAKNASSSDWAAMVGNLGDAVVQMAKDVLDYGREDVFGMTNEDFSRQYGMPKSLAMKGMKEAGMFDENVNSFQRNQWRKALDELDKQGVEAFLNEGMLPVRPTAEALRSKTDQAAANLRNDVITDVATSVIGASKPIGLAGKVSTSTPVLGKTPVLSKQLANTAEVAGVGALASGTGEMAKNLGSGKPVGEGVAQAALMDAILGGTGELVSSSAGKKVNANIARDVLSGEKLMRELNEVGGKIAKADTAFAAMKEGTIGGWSSLRDVIRRQDYDLSIDFEALNAAPKHAVREMNDIFKNDPNITPKAFSDKATAIKGISEKQASIFWKLKNGDYDARFKVAKNVEVERFTSMIDDPAVNTYLRAHNLEDLGTFARAMANVSDIQGSGKMARALSWANTNFGFGFAQWIEKHATDNAKDRISTQGRKELQTILNNARDELKAESYRIENVLERIRNIEKDMDDIRKSKPILPFPVEGKLKGLKRAIKKAEDEWLNSKTNTPEAEANHKKYQEAQKAYDDYLKAETGKAHEDALKTQQNLLDNELTSLSKSRYINAEKEANIDALSRNLNKKVLTNQDIIDLSNSFYQGARETWQESKTRGGVDRITKSEKQSQLDKAIASLYETKESAKTRKRHERSFSDRFVMMGILSYATSFMFVPAQIAISIGNMTLGSKTKKSMLKGLDIVRVYQDKLIEANNKMLESKKNPNARAEFEKKRAELDQWAEDSLYEIDKGALSRLFDVMAIRGKIAAKQSEEEMFIE